MRDTGGVQLEGSTKGELAVGEKKFSIILIHKGHPIGGAARDVTISLNWRWVGLGIGLKEIAHGRRVGRMGQNTSGNLIEDIIPIHIMRKGRGVALDREWVGEEILISKATQVGITLTSGGVAGGLE